MKYLKKFESCEIPQILELKDMALELTDMGYNVEIIKSKNIFSNPKYPYKPNDIHITITRRGSDGNNVFTMKIDVRDFLFRIINYMEENGYHFEAHSNHGRLYFVKDGRIILASGEARERYPSFTVINILFKK